MDTGTRITDWFTWKHVLLMIVGLVVLAVVVLVINVLI